MGQSTEANKFQKAIHVSLPRLREALFAGRASREARSQPYVIRNSDLCAVANVPYQMLLKRSFIAPSQIANADSFGKISVLVISNAIWDAVAQVC